MPSGGLLSPTRISSYWVVVLGEEKPGVVLRPKSGIGMMGALPLRSLRRAVGVRCGRDSLAAARFADPDSAQKLVKIHSSLCAEMANQMAPLWAPRRDQAISQLDSVVAIDRVSMVGLFYSPDGHSRVLMASTYSNPNMLRLRGGEDTAGGAGGFDIDSMLAAAKSPEAIAELKKLMEDPDAMAEAKAMMDDPEFRQQMRDALAKGGGEADKLDELRKAVGGDGEVKGHASDARPVAWRIARHFEVCVPHIRRV